MGMLGAYDAHFYCDVCKECTTSDQVHTAEEARTQVREEGWKFRRDGAILCPQHANDKTPALISEDKREGSDWREYPRKNSF